MLKPKFLVIIAFLFSCSQHQLLAQKNDGERKFKDISCEEMIDLSKKADFTLKNLAGLRAHRNCKEFIYDPTVMTPFEKRLFQQEIDLNTVRRSLDPTEKTDQEEIKDLRSQLKTEKNVKVNVTAKWSIYKKLYAKYRATGQREPSQKTRKEAHKWLTKDLKKSPKNIELQKAYYESSLLIARQYWTESETAMAEKTIADTITNLKPQTILPDLYFLKARIHEEKDEFAFANAFYELALLDLDKNPFVSILTIEKITWNKAWLLYKNEKWAEAEVLFKNLVTQYIDVSDQSRSAFFQARCLKKMDKVPQAEALLADIIEKDFFSYYAFAAHQELGRKISAFKKLKKTGEFVFDDKLSFLEVSEKNIFLDLIKYKEIDLAERFILIKTTTPQQNAYLSLVLAEKGQRFLPLFAAFGKLSYNEKKDVLIDFHHLMFPRLYEENVSTMAEKTELPSSLIFAIMRQESAFNELSRSHANAYGLMQVIPALAKQLARKHNLPYKTVDDLYVPDLNIQLGSFELQHQVKKQNGQLTFVAAAYNAGPNALAKWLKTKWKPQFDIIDFIEEIPYDETKLYVKVIARNSLFYDRLKKKDQEHDFPMDFIKSEKVISQNETP